MRRQNNPVRRQNRFDPDSDLGPCCVCEKEDSTVRNLVMLNRKGEPGKGWGCFVCHLPRDGATAVLCDACLKNGVEEARLRYVIAGYPIEKRRMPYAALSEERHEHDLRYHPERWSTAPGGSLSPLAVAAQEQLPDEAQGDDEYEEDGPLPLLLFYTHPNGDVGMFNAGPVETGFRYMQEAGWRWKAGVFSPPDGVQQ